MAVMATGRQINRLADSLDLNRLIQMIHTRMPAGRIDSVKSREIA